MTDPRRHRFAGYLRTLADRMGLKDWAVTLAHDAPRESDAMASVNLTYGQRRLTVRVCDDFLGCDPERQRAYLVHELVHAHVEPAWQIAIGGLASEVHPAFERMAEYGVDAIAVAWAELLPLPPQNKSKR